MKELFHLLLPFLDKKWYPGKGIRWIIRDSQGHTPYCVFCGNYANVVGRVKFMGQTFNLPICKTHTMSYMDKHHPEGWELNAPTVIKMNVKFIPFKCQNCFLICKGCAE